MIQKEGSHVNKQLCIIAVDDDPAILRLLTRAFEPEGYRVCVAANGLAALALMEKCHPDLFILDIMMPELDGIQLLTRLRQCCDTPVIMLTAKQDVATLNQALSLGADDYMRKPFSLMELTARVRARLRQSVSEIQN